MLKKITLENFFSFGERTEIALHSGVNVLVGINGSGKSNFLKAIRLLHEGISGIGLEKLFIQEWGGFDSVVNFDYKQSDQIKLKFEFDQKAFGKYGLIWNSLGVTPTYEISISRVGNSSYQLSEYLYVGGKEKIVEYLKTEGTEGFISTNSKDELKYLDLYKGNFKYKSTELVLRQIADPTTFYPLYTIRSVIEESTVYSHFDTTFKSPIRHPQASGTETKLLPDAGNINSIIIELQNNHSLEYGKIVEHIRQINPNFKDLSFRFLGAKSILHLQENELSRAVSVEHISDGSLRFLILLTIAFNPNRGSLLCIDEPEIGLHPDMINTLSKAIKNYASRTSQFIFATHSPLLLNCFDLEEILIFEKDKDNQTRVLTKSEEDFEDWNDDYLAGQLWLRGALGGKRW